MLNKYPYTDYHELNTDWIIGKIKNVETAEANTKQYAEDADAAKIAAQDAQTAAEDARDIAVHAKDDAVDAKDAAIDFLDDTKDQLDLLQARVDNIIPDGTQTAGNTELLDIRVSYDSITYGSAGNAVRAQVSNLHTEIDDMQETTDNLFFMTVLHDDYNGVTVDIQPDGSYKFNGTATGSIHFRTFGAANRTDPILPAGTYSFGWEKISGTSSANTTDFSLRVGGAGSGDSMVYDGKAARENITFNDTAVSTIYIKSGTVLTNYIVKIWCNENSTLLPYKPHKDTLDYTAREKADRALSYINNLDSSLSNMTLKYPMVLGDKSVRGQGGTLIGSNLFCWVRNPTGGQTTGDVHYFNIKTGDTYRSDDVHSGITDVNIGHGNDVCYNPNDDCLYVVTMLPSGEVAKLTDATYAEYDSAIIPLDGDGNSFESYAIAFNQATNEYMLYAGSDTIHIFDSAWAYQRSITLEHWSSGLTATQGMDTDGTYIYLITSGSNPPAYTTYILTYDMSGNLVEEYLMKQFSDDADGLETEGIAYDWVNGYFVTNNMVHDLGNHMRLFNIVPNSMSYHSVGITSLMIKRWFANNTF